MYIFLRCITILVKSEYLQIILLNYSYVFVFCMFLLVINEINWFFQPSFSFKIYHFSIILFLKEVNNFFSNFPFLWTNLQTHFLCQFLANWRQWVKPIVYIRKRFLLSFGLFYRYSQQFYFLWYFYFLWH